MTSARLTLNKQDYSLVSLEHGLLQPTNQREVYENGLIEITGCDVWGIIRDTRRRLEAAQGEEEELCNAILNHLA